jgi:hypothetical protein
MNQLVSGFGDKPNLFLQFLAEEEHVTLIDTTGAVAPAFADRLHKVKNALYLDPSDINHPVGLNVFDGVPNHQLLTDQLTDYIYDLFPAGANTLTRENSSFLLENTIRVLLVQDGPQTLLSILKFLKSETFREACLTSRKIDAVVAENWSTINDLDQKTRQAVFFSLQTKIGRLLMEPTVRNIVGQPYNTFGDDITVVIANLDREKIGNKAAKLLGGLLIARSQGQVVIPDYGFFDTPIPLEQNRFTLGVNFLDDSRQNLLAIEDKYVFATHEDDAKILKRYVNVVEERNIMDMAYNQYRIVDSDRPFRTVETPSLKRLRALQKKTRACHTALRSEVERDIKRYLA